MLLNAKYRLQNLKTKIKPDGLKIMAPQIQNKVI